MFNRCYPSAQGADEINRAVALGYILGYGCEECECLVLTLDFDDVHYLRIEIEGNGAGIRYQPKEVRVESRQEFYRTFAALAPRHLLAGIVAIIPREGEIENIDMAASLQRQTLAHDIGCAVTFTLTPVKTLVRALHEFEGIEF